MKAMLDKKTGKLIPVVHIIVCTDLHAAMGPFFEEDESIAAATVMTQETDCTFVPLVLYPNPFTEERAPTEKKSKKPKLDPETQAWADSIDWSKRGYI